jgi:Uma2 family endonuclease
MTATLLAQPQRQEKMPTVDTPARITATELLTLSKDSAHRYELTQGDLKTMSPAGAKHGDIALEIGSRIRIHATDQQLGRAFGAETGFLIERNPDTVRAPDAAFVSQARLQETGVPTTYFPGAPDLAVEVVSPGDTAGEVEEKVQMWLAHGASLVWVIYPATRTVTAYRRDGSANVLLDDDLLDGEAVLPGFSFAVSRLFL